MELASLIVITLLAASAGAAIGLLMGRARTAAAEAKAERLPQLEGRLLEAEQQVSTLNAQIATLNTQLLQERQQSTEKLVLLQSAREELSHQFKNLANDILEEKSKRFSEQNQQSLGQLLEPLKSRLQEFQGKVEQVYVQEGKDRSALAEQVRQLMELNKTVSQEANNLTRALKGSNKTQGNWGELILERVLETAGLRKGDEFDVQESHTTADGKRLQPDVVLHLPEDRHLVIDAKATLVAYEDYANAEDDKHRDAALKRHLEAVRGHIKGLSDKNYQDLYGLKSLDFVLMFVPIEPAFMLAVTHDRELFMDAWNKNVLLVSPSTLLFVVRTVASLWRQEAQNRNAQDIAKRGAELYDKLAGFVEDMESLGNRLGQAQKDYDGAISKLATGRGNLIRQAEMLKKLGVKPNKALPTPMVEQAHESNDSADME
jgi:DNA recombination protein RmuC